MQGRAAVRGSMKQLTRAEWSRLSASEQKETARRIARSLPDGFVFDRVAAHTFCNQQNAIAEYTYRGARFVLIPGGEAVLGYDASREWKPTPDEAQDWQQTAQAYDLNHTIQEQIARATLRPRTVFLDAVLMEASAYEPAWEPLSPQSPEVQKSIREEFGTSARARRIEVMRKEASLRVARDDNGVITASRALPLTHPELAARLALDGFRLPTSDEWEYACGASAATLFRWGDHIPCDRYPTDVSPDEAAWRREWAQSGGTAKPPPGGFTPDWNWHDRANALGIHIASNPYHFELVAEPNITRGGDGGCTICGGAGFFVGWLTLATAYFEAEICEMDATQPIDSDYTICRRVLPLM